MHLALPRRSSLSDPVTLEAKDLSYQPLPYSSMASETNRKLSSRRMNYTMLDSGVPLFGRKTCC